MSAAHTNASELMKAKRDPAVMKRDWTRHELDAARALLDSVLQLDDSGQVCMPSNELAVTTVQFNDLMDHIRTFLKGE